MATHFPIVFEQEDSGAYGAYVAGLPVYAGPYASARGECDCSDPPCVFRGPSTGAAAGGSAGRESVGPDVSADARARWLPARPRILVVAETRRGGGRPPRPAIGSRAVGFVFNVNQTSIRSGRGSRRGRGIMRLSTDPPCRPERSGLLLRRHRVGSPERQASRLELRLQIEVARNDGCRGAGLRFITARAELKIALSSFSESRQGEAVAVLVGGIA
jgi:hypothetical protein